MTRVPKDLKSLFWDVDFEKINPSESPHFIIKRVLDRGNTSSVKWLLSQFKKDDIIKTITISRDLTPKTANYWADIYNLNKSNIACLQKPYSRIPFGQSS